MPSLTAMAIIVIVPVIEIGVSESYFMPKPSPGGTSFVVYQISAPVVVVVSSTVVPLATSPAGGFAIGWATWSKVPFPALMLLLSPQDVNASVRTKNNKIKLLVVQRKKEISFIKFIIFTSFIKYKNFSWF
jgi:hypothetical protein